MRQNVQNNCACTQWCAKVRVCVVFGFSWEAARRIPMPRQPTSFRLLPTLFRIYVPAFAFPPFFWLCTNMDMLSHSFLFYNMRITR
jgi:hypothetical protein